MCTSNWPVLVRNCLNPRNLKPEESSGSLQTHMGPVSPNKNITARVVGTESNLGILIHMPCSHTQKCNSKQELTQEGEKNEM